MPNRINADSLPMDHWTSAAVCNGIGERLRDVLKPSDAELPPRLRELMEQLKKIDEADAPSIVPALDTASRTH